MKRSVLLQACCAIALMAAVAGASANEAERILQAAGVQGGLIVHLGCGDGKLTAALRASDSFIVHGLDADASNVAAARRHIQSCGLYGKVAVEPWDGKRLPYVDNLANLIVVSGGHRLGDDEIMRVLVPNGVALVGGKKTVKPRPNEIDDWTHYLHDASNNAVAQDSVVGPPRHYQWIGSPRWSRHHDRMSSISAMVSAGGRIFYIFDEGSIASIMMPPRWSLVARDAFNGTILWKRAIPTWHPHLYPFKSGPTQLTRRLVADGERVYVTLGRAAPLAVLDAATGETVQTFDDTRATEEVLLSDGVVFALVNASPMDWSQFQPLVNNIGEEKARVARDYPWDEKPRQIVALDAASGKTLWRKAFAVMPMTLAADRRAVYFHDGQRIVCLDRRQGGELWRSEPVSRQRFIPTCFGATLVVYREVVLFAGGDRKMHGLSAQTGKILWTAAHHPGGHNSPEDLLVVGGLAWSGAIANTRDSGVFTGLDPMTGEVKAEFAPDTDIYFMHHRCHRSKATERYLIPSRTGIEFVDPATKHWTTHHWVRSGCIYGIMPCNGLVYITPHDCACYMEAKLNSFGALAPARSESRRAESMERLERGPAYAPIAGFQSSIPSPSDWPTYRHDAARSGATTTALPAELNRVWQTELGGKLTSIVAAGGKLFVASVDTHTVHALDAESGKKLWSFSAGGRVDSPPTIWQGRALFGSADGYVYCLRASDGALAWRFRAAPEDRRLVAYEQVESVWPVPGNVLVHDGIAWCVAGRSMFLDGGLHLLRLDAKTGRLLSETILDERVPETNENLQSHVRQLNMPVALPDVLSCDGRYVYMRSQRFDLEGRRQDIGPRELRDQLGEGAHLFSPTGFLDDTWWHRSYWIFGRTFMQGAGGWPQAGKVVPAGRILAFDGETIYGFGRQPDYYKWTTPVEHQLFAAGKQPREVPVREPAAKTAKSKAAARKAAQNPKRAGLAVDYRWTTPVPLYVRAMVLAGPTLWFAGPPELVSEADAFRKANDPAMLAQLRQQDEAFEGKRGALLWAVSAADGKQLGQWRLESLPVFDGMIAADARLYLSTSDGRVLCMGGR